MDWINNDTKKLIEDFHVAANILLKRSAFLFLASSHESFYKYFSNENANYIVDIIKGLDKRLINNSPIIFYSIVKSYNLENLSESNKDVLWKIINETDMYDFFLEVYAWEKNNRIEPLLINDFKSIFTFLMNNNIPFYIIREMIYFKLIDISEFIMISYLFHKWWKPIETSQWKLIFELVNDENLIKNKIIKNIQSEIM